MARTAARGIRRMWQKWVEIVQCGDGGYKGGPLEASGANNETSLCARCCVSCAKCSTSRSPTGLCGGCRLMRQLAIERVLTRAKKPASYIRLRGLWLRELGFEPGT